MKKHSEKNDIILLFCLAAAGLVFLLIYLFSRPQGNIVEVSVNGQSAVRFSLSDDIRYEVGGYNGGSNIVVISGGRVWMEDADCPDRLCVNMGKISRPGRPIVCLPHRVVVQILPGEGEDIPDGSDSNDTYDITTG